MGNRAVITIEGSKTGIYLHWNGGRESVEAFLKAAKDLGVRSPGGDPSYFYARLTQIIANYFGGTISVGIDALESLDTDNGDNGVFVVGSDFKIVRRDHVRGNWRNAHVNKDYSAGVYDEVMKKNAPLFNSKE